MLPNLQRVAVSTYVACVAIRRVAEDINGTIEALGALQNNLAGVIQLVAGQAVESIPQAQVQQVSSALVLTVAVGIAAAAIFTPQGNQAQQAPAPMRNTMSRRTRERFQRRAFVREGSILVFVRVSTDQTTCVKELNHIVTEIAQVIQEDFTESKAATKEVYRISIEFGLACLQTLYEMKTKIPRSIGISLLRPFFCYESRAINQGADIAVFKTGLNSSSILISPRKLDLIIAMPIEECLDKILQSFEFEDTKEWGMSMIPILASPSSSDPQISEISSPDPSKLSLKRKIDLVLDDDNNEDNQSSQTLDGNEFYKRILIIEPKTKRSYIINQLLEKGILSREPKHVTRLNIKTYRNQLKSLTADKLANASEIAFGHNNRESTTNRQQKNKKAKAEQDFKLHFQSKIHKMRLCSNAFSFGYAIENTTNQTQPIAMEMEDLFEEISEITRNSDIYSFANANDILLDESLVEESINDIFPVNGLFRDEVLVSSLSVHTLSIYFHQLLLLAESMGNDIGTPDTWDLSDGHTILKNVKWDLMRINDVDLREIMQSFDEFVRGLTSEIFVLERRLGRGKDSVWMIFRKFPTETNDVILKVSFLLTFENQNQNQVTEMEIERPVTFPLVLELLTLPENTIDTVEIHVTDRSFTSVMNAFTNNFSKLKDSKFQILYEERELNPSSSLDRLWEINPVPTFRVKKDITEARPETQIAFTSTSIVPVFTSQVMVANEICDRSTIILSEKLQTFNKLDFLIFVPKYNTLKQQTIDRLGRFNSFVHGLTESDIADRVLLYPVQDKHKITMKAYADRIVAEENTLFLIIVDECHFAPTINAIPLLHDVDVVGRENVLVLMVSATPYNVLSKQSKIRRDNVIDWMDILRDKTKKDTYIGFEYYARSMTFDCADPKFTVANDAEQMTQIELNSWREYATFNALALAISSQLKVSGFPTVVFTYNSSMKRFEISYSGNTSVYLSGEFLSELGFLQDQPLFLNAQNKEIFGTPNNAITVDDESSPIDSRLIRTDTSFVAIRQCLESSFTYLKNARGSNNVEDEVMEDVVQKKKKTKANLGKVALSLHKFLDFNATEDGRKTPQGHSKPAAARNGFIIVLDYIFSICFYSVAFDQNHKQVDVSMFNRDMAVKFVQNLYESCSYDNGEEFFNLTNEASSILHKMIEEARKELQSVTPDNESPGPYEILHYILQQKRKYIGVNTAETETWYTETDRIIYKLLNPSNSPAMVLLRCYDNDENRSMQKILRNALRVCKLFEPGTNIPACSVIGDISRTRIIETIEPEYRSKKVTHAMFGECMIKDIPKLRARTFDGNNGNGGLKITDDLKYEDLNGIRCLLILCEKGRMGDTFPPSLSVLDFRLRTCGNGAGFIQEMGRMCRYPKYEKSNATVIANDPLLNIFDASASSNEFEAKYPNGCLVMLQDDECVGLARNSYQLCKILLALRDSPGMESQQITLYHLSSPLPYALISADYIGAIEKAIDQREAKIFAENPTLSPFDIEKKREEKDNRILWHLSSPGSLDTYLDQKFKTISKAFEYSIAKKSKHYDLANIDKREILSRNRILLQAECQIGKTGAFLAFLSLLNDRLRLNITTELPPVSKSLVRGAREAAKKGYRWYLPYWRNLHLQAPIPYSLPKIGKYHEKILEIRVMCLAGILSRGNGGAGSTVSLFEKYKRELKRNEFIISTLREEEELEKLRNVDPSDPQYFKLLLNWDGRMNLNPESLQHYLNILSDPKQVTQFIYQMDRPDPIEFRESDRRLIPTIVLNDDEEPIEGSDDQTSNILSMVQSIPPETTNISYSAKSRLTVPLSPAGLVISENRQGINGVQFRITFPAAALQNYQDSNFAPKVPRVIKNWIFTPSFAGRSNLMEKLLVRKDSFSPLVPWDDYFQVLVVRESQFDEYKKYFGHEYIVIGMPESLVVPFPGEQGQGGIVSRTITAHEGGIGLTRRFIQYIARHYFKLSQIWMLDDNIKDCYQLSVPRSNMPPTGLTYRKVSFAEVMTSIEAIISPTNDQNPLPASQAFMDLQYIKQETNERYFQAPDAQVLLRAGRSVISDTNPQTIYHLSDFIGHEQQYGIIGINRCLITQRQVIKEPVKVTHSIYSFFLLNLAALEEHQLYYSPRPIWEDVEMNHMIERKGLLCCKLQAFVHYKPPHGLTGPNPLPPLPPPQPDFPNNYRDELKACVFRELVPPHHRMNELDKAKEIAESYRLTIDGKENTQCFVLFAHDLHLDIRPEIKYHLKDSQEILLILRHDAKLMEIQGDNQLKVTDLIVFEVEDDGIVDSSYRIYRLHRL